MIYSVIKIILSDKYQIIFGTILGIKTVVILMIRFEIIIIVLK